MQNLFTIQTVAIFVVIALPGIIGQMAYALTISKPIDALQNQLVSIFAFGCLNFVFVSWPWVKLVGYPIDPGQLSLLAWATSFVCLVIFPLTLGWALANALKFAVARNWFGQGSESEWDFAFNWAKEQKEEVWFLVETIDAESFAARLDDASFATTGKSPRGLFFGNAWPLDSQGEFDVAQEPVGILFSEKQIARLTIRMNTNEGS